MENSPIINKEGSKDPRTEANLQTFNFNIYCQTQLCWPIRKDNIFAERRGDRSVSRE